MPFYPATHHAAGCIALAAALAGCATPYDDMAVSAATPGATPVAAATVVQPGASGAQGQIIESEFRCGNQAVQTEYSRPDNQMTLRLGGQSLALAPAMSASGARFTGTSAQGPVEFWNKGNEAMLTIGTTTFPTCLELPGARRMR